MNNLLNKQVRSRFDVAHVASVDSLTSPHGAKNGTKKHGKINDVEILSTLSPPMCTEVLS